MENFSIKQVKEIVIEECKEKQKCSVNIPYKLIGISKEEQRYDQFVFAQVTCEQDEDDGIFKNHMGLVVASCGMIICLVFRLSLNYIH